MTMTCSSLLHYHILHVYTCIWCKWKLSSYMIVQANICIFVGFFIPLPFIFILWLKFITISTTLCVCVLRYSLTSVCVSNMHVKQSIHLVFILLYFQEWCLYGNHKQIYILQNFENSDPILKQFLSFSVLLISYVMHLLIN